ncbi:MAG TPA: GGDEF domain-containing protein, partial [Actinotalea sp.]|nr:GGDEF domain-containing protein [Actinotalea sp.]
MTGVTAMQAERPAGRSGMQRAETALFLVGAAGVALGIVTTQQLPGQRLVQAAVAGVFPLDGAWLWLGGVRSQRTLEGLAMLAMALVGVLVAISTPLSAAPFFMVWPMTLVAYFSPRERLVPAAAVALASLAAGLLVHPPSPIKLDMFIFTSLTTGVLAWLVSSVTARQDELRSELARAAETDPLTGVLNRRAFHPRLEHLIALSARTGSPLALVMFDLDHFKRINDTRGHQAGDKVLEHVAASLRHVSRAADLVARVGGEEFVVALPGAGAAEAVRYATRAAERM